MRALSVSAKDRGAAEGIYCALADFKPELSGSDEEGYQVAVKLGSFDHQVIAVLEVLQAYVISRDDGPARVELDGRSYTLRNEWPEM